jgi:hypothetical protein
VAIRPDRSGRILFSRLVLDPVEAFDRSTIARIPSARLRDRLAAWADAGERLFPWVAYRDRAAEARRLS